MPADEETTPLSVSRNSSLLQVLVVDDSVAIQKVMKRWLERNCCTVTIAENGKLGLALLKEKLFDITFMDFLMVSLNEFTLLIFVYSYLFQCCVACNAWSGCDEKFLPLERRIFLS